MSFASPLPRSRWSDVYIAAFAQLFGSMGTFLVMVTLVLALQQRGGSGIQVSALIISEAVPMVVLGSLIGRLVDRVDSRLLLVLAGIGQIVACLALSFATTFAALVGLATAMSLVSAVAIPTRQALLPAMVLRDDLPKASALGQTASNAGMMVGPAAAGFLVGGLGVAPTLRLAALGFLATIAAGLLLRTRRGGAASAMSTPDGDAPAPVTWKLRDDRLLWTSAWGLTAVISAVAAVNVVIVFFIMRTLHSTTTMYGLVDSMWTVGALVGAWIFSRLVRPSTSDVSVARLLLLAIGGASLAVIGVGSAQAALWIVPFYLFGGAQNGGLNVLAGTLVGRRVPHAAMGRANTALGMRIQAGSLLGYIGGGLLLEWSQPRWIVLGCGILGVAMVCAVLPLIKPSAAPAPAAAASGELVSAK